ncbi:DNA damage-binding protein 2-like [Antedon mediterranea]|uniref:DNA damage-binding protein 2-like n=1 Tax=Antedon mediterranea TaxID=105859 RepID=UPI003AF8053D
MAPGGKTRKSSRKQVDLKTKKHEIKLKIQANAKKPIIRWQNKNILHTLYQYRAGCCTTNNIRQAIIKPFQEKLTKYRILRTSSPFDRRVTSMAWHPTKPTTMCVASKSGDFLLWDYEKLDHSQFVRGLGKGGSIPALKFDIDSPDHIYTVSGDGLVLRQDFEGRSRQVFFNTNDWSFWFCSLDVSFKANLVVAGDNVGKVCLFTRQGEKVSSDRLHKAKVTHCEFNPSCDWLLATASVDKTVKLWDVRMMKDKNSFVQCLSHEKPINSAYFSPDGSRLLTTDQHVDIRIYSGPYWSDTYNTIVHPHRFYQHITPFKATWHPVHDIIVIGRYPDSSFPGYRDGECRTVDMFNANTGKIICQLLDPSASGIISLNMFNPKTDALVSAMGYHILVWIGDEEAFEKQQKVMESLRANSSNIGGPSTYRRPRRRRDNNDENDEDDDDVSSMKKKIKKPKQSKAKEEKENQKVKIKGKKSK